MNPPEPRPDDLFVSAQSETDYKKDVEGGDDAATDESDTVGFWEKKQKELQVSVVDYNLSTLASLIDTQAIDLSPKYQRRFRWTNDRQSKLIESFLMNVPVPPVFLNEDEYGKYSVIDGKQRLTAINNMMRGRLTLSGLKVFRDINGKNIDDLPHALRTVMSVRPTVRAIIILRHSDKDIKFEVFRRLNTGGVKLNAQEIRNSTHPGPLNDLILELSETAAFHDLLGIHSKSKSALYQEMRDAEFVLRYFAFRLNWESYSGGMMRQLDNFMADNAKANPKELAELKTDFLQTIATVKAAFGVAAFKRWQPDKQAWRKQVLAALFDAEMFALRGYTEAQVAPNSQALMDGMKTLQADTEFQKSISAATNTPTLFIDRIKAVRSMVHQIVG